ncbi:HAD family hydrolase [Streptomyces sp. NPDC059853]|uniref:HAD family hydrolase n=1 Tax=Streptomyces sp. NPDC059853 TaxID=3346973 RepID=UPI0036625B18
MPLLLLDLDNTLIDRDTAFRAAAAAFLAEHALPADDLAWLMRLDAGGYGLRDDIAAALAGRYGDAVPASAVLAFLDLGGADRVVLAAAVRDALGEAVAAGWTCAIVTNGTVAQQERKIRRTGLDRLVHGWVISEALGCTKPAPEIFRAAADATGAALPGAWVVGDSPHADVRGALAIGARSVWVSGGRAWREAAYRPTHVTAHVAPAIRHVIGQPR